MSERVEEQIQQLIRNCSDMKMISGNEEQAKTLAQEAYQLAEEEKLHPWQELAAYRLAMILLRDRAERSERLEHIDQLLKLASTPRQRTPFASVHVLAAIYRLAPLRQLAHRDDGRVAELHAAFQHAVTCLQEAERRPSLNDESRHILQSRFFNLVELSSLFLDVEYEDLAGRGVEIFPQAKNAWVMWSSVGHQGKVLMSQSFAESSLINQGVQNPGALLLQLRHNESGDCRWRMSDSESWLPLPVNTARLIAHKVWESHQSDQPSPERFGPEEQVSKYWNDARKNIKDSGRIDPFTKSGGRWIFRPDFKVFVITKKKPNSRR